MEFFDAEIMARDLMGYGWITTKTGVLMKKRILGAVILCSLITAGANAGLLSGKKVGGEKEAKKWGDGDAVVIAPATTKPKPIRY